LHARLSAALIVVTHDRAQGRYRVTSAGISTMPTTSRQCCKPHICWIGTLGPIGRARVAS
jgi:hypothetical protein